MNELVIAGVTIIQDAHGRYNLNALHRASEQAGDQAKVPSQWLRRKSTKDLITRCGERNVNLHYAVIEDVPASGIFAHEILAVEYAGWISTDFRLTVNQAFIDSRTPSQLPRLHDPKLQMLLEAIVRMDAIEQQLALTTREATEAKDLALGVMRAQSWLTIRQYVFVHDLHHQLPLKTQQEYARWLGGYCLEKGLPMYKAQTADRAWADERTYYIGAINDTLHGWLKRNQAGLSLVPGLSATRDKETTT
jgi:hypothetical protein